LRRLEPQGLLRVRPRQRTKGAVAKKTLKIAGGCGCCGRSATCQSQEAEGVEWSRCRPGSRRRRASRRSSACRLPYNRFQELLADDSIERWTSPPNYLHAPMAAAALEAGKHVLCERPLARSGTEAAAMARAAKKADRLLMCALQHRFHPHAQLLKKFVEKGDLGEIFLAKGGWLRQKTEWDSDEWRAQKRESGGGVVRRFQMLDKALWNWAGRRWVTASDRLAGARSRIPRPRSCASRAAPR
jgi:hypothetical protein